MRRSPETSLTAPTDGATTIPPLVVRRHGRARLIVGYVTVAAILPYLILKLIWISGSTVGISDPSPLDAAVVDGGNVVTATMELIAIAIVLTFTHSWGLRVPAWLVLVPAWIGTGLLAPFVVTGPVVAVSVVTEASPVGDGSLAPWVGPLVYLGFGTQAIGIASSFAIHAHDRWAGVLAGRLSDRPTGPSRPALVLITWVIVALLTVVSGSRLLWGMGVTWGLPSHLIDGRGVAERLADTSAAFFAIAAIIGFLLLTCLRFRRVRTWVPIVLAWVGSGATLTSGAYSLALLLLKLSGAVTSPPRPGVVPFVDLVQIVAGTAAAVVGAVLLTELRASERADGSGTRTHAGRPSPRLVGSTGALVVPSRRS